MTLHTLKKNYRSFNTKARGLGQRLQLFCSSFIQSNAEKVVLRYSKNFLLFVDFKTYIYYDEVIKILS